VVKGGGKIQKQTGIGRGRLGVKQTRGLVAGGERLLVNKKGAPGCVQSRNAG